MNTTADGLPIPGEEACGGAEVCTFREALVKANEDADEDTISFAGIPAGSVLTIEEATLPSIDTRMKIDGFTASATPGVPGVEIVPANFDEERPIALTLHGAEGVRIEGLAIDGWGVGIRIGPEEDRGAVGTEICGDYLGPKLSGLEALANEVGIEVDSGTGIERTEGTRIGDPGEGCEGNVISGNTSFGVEDEGLDTTIAGNEIGLGPARGGSLSMPNGAGGILEETQASGTMIGGVTPGSGEVNTIWFNEGPGVKVETAASEVAIRRNSIFENQGLGIQVLAGPQPAPTIERAELVGTELFVEGTVDGIPPDTVELEIFGNDACEPGGTGQGTTILGSHPVPLVTGSNRYEFTLPAPPVAETGFTATATRHEGVGGTSQFSECLTFKPERTFTVDTLDNLSHGGDECRTVCSLRDAIELANLTEAKDTIDFAAGGSGVIDVEPDPLPWVTAPVRIDGTSAPGYAGVPLVEIDGTEAHEEGPVDGIVLANGESVIEGTAVSDFFNYGIVLGASGSRVCSSWLGVGLDGTSSPDGAGILVAEDSVGDEIGVGCEAGASQNVIAGNREAGIEVLGSEAKIGGNRIGITAAGAVDGNEAAGIHVFGPAFRPEIGAVAGAVGPNEIAYNDGGGVVVESAANAARIRANAIYANGGKGIEIEEDAPAVPTIAAVESADGGITVAGTVTSGEQEPIELDFFAAAVCEPLDAGEGETFLGTAEIEAGQPGPNAFSESVAAPPSDDQTFITVTATSALAGRTSEFSGCFKYVPPEPEPEEEEEKEEGKEETKPPPTGGDTTSGGPPAQAAAVHGVTLAPTNGEKVVVKPEAGKVKIKLPGTNKYVPLEELKEIPVGAIIDATKGKVHLVSVGPNGEEQSADFFGGVFKVKQKEGAGLVVLELLDSNTCTAPERTGGKGGKGGKGKGGKGRAQGSAVSARPEGGGTAGKLWGSGHGNFRTEGNDGSATVRGTIWLVEDRCDGTTFFKTRRDVVTVKDFITHKTFPLREGHSYVAGE
ncbi:MAG TPA: hypothetical protein VHZ54_17965 [Solirubrobacterales bacterium]|nr:hypothetical protein [Solirubrobacterales bacterium]